MTDVPAGHLHYCITATVDVGEWDLGSGTPLGLLGSLALVKLGNGQRCQENTHTVI